MALYRRTYSPDPRLHTCEVVYCRPLAYANVGEARPFCPLIISVGVQALLYDAAVAAADGVREILGNAGLPDIEVAFIESVATRSCGPQDQQNSRENRSPLFSAFPS
ncbi:hypothetical protein C8Q74DRAFT_1260722 [Fomes fomentarius]|nr:hypothetical protein C8Q74DRAFT_1260722 [Fomes fomentarius]